MLFKKNTVLVTCLCLTVLLSSCALTGDKSTVYCFSAVFEAVNEVPVMTLYCRKPSGKDTDTAEEADIKLSLNGENFSDILKQCEESEYEIYFNSMRALYFDSSISKEQIKEIAVLLLNNTKYQTSLYVYSPEEKSDSLPETLHELALKVCRDKGVNPVQKKNYMFSAGYFRNRTE